MKAKDLKTLETFIAEYGMKPGVSTPVGNQQTGSMAKSTTASKTSSASTVKPSTGTNTSITSKLKPSAPQVKTTAAKDVKAGTKISTDDGELEVVGSIDDNNQVVAKDAKGNLTSIDPDAQVVAEDEKAKQADRILKRKHKLKNKIKRTLRASKYRTQGDPIFEINFNDSEVIKTALDSNISCGFEAEVTFPDIDTGYSEDEINDMSWSEIEDIVYDLEGQRGVDNIRESYSTWMYDSHQFADVERDVMEELVNERIDDPYYIQQYIDYVVDEDDIRDYIESEDKEDEDYDVMAREYVLEEQRDQYEEYLMDDIRDNGEHFDDAVMRFERDYDMDWWAGNEYYGWMDVLTDNDIYLSGSDEDEADAISDVIQTWAENNSEFTDVQAGSYHSGAGDTEQSFWRVEDDSSVQGDGAKGEIISPVYSSPREMLVEMKSLFEMLESENAETNSTTGLHVTMSLNGDVGPENPLKMALLLGDKYLLKQFGREFNNYAKSQQDAVLSAAQRLERGAISDEGLETIEGILKRGISFQKFSSINFKDITNNDGNKLIEFRIGGGRDYHEQFDKMAKSVIRYGATMLAGHDKDAYRQDYLKAIVKLVNKATDGLTDDERAEMEKGAGLDLAQTPFVDFLKTHASKDNYLDRLELYKSAIDGNVQSANKLMNMLISDTIGNQIQPGPKTARVVRMGMKDMNIDLNKYVEQLKTASVKLNLGDIDKAKEHLGKLIAGFNTLIKANLTVPELNVPQLKVPENHVLFVDQATLTSMRDHEAYDAKQIKTVPTEDWRETAHVVIALDSIKNNRSSRSIELYTDQTGLEATDPKLEKMLTDKYNEFVNKHGFKPAAPGIDNPADAWMPANVQSLARQMVDHPTQPMAIVKESVFDRFDSLTLNEQLAIISRVDKSKIDEAWSKKYKSSIDCDNPKGFSQRAHCAGKKKKNETIEAEQDIAALLTAYGTPKKKKKRKKTAENCEHGSYYCSTDKKTKCRKGPKKSRKVKEGAVPDHNIERDYAEIMSKPLLGSDIQGQMQAYFVVPDPSMIRDFREQISTGGKEVDLRPTFKAYAQRQLHPKQKDAISESVVKEAKITRADLIKADQPYLLNLLDMIRAGTPVGVVGSDPVVIDPSEADRIASIYFPDGDPSKANIEQGDRPKYVPANKAALSSKNNIILKTDKGQVNLFNLDKDSVKGDKVTYNKGDVSEILVGIAVVDFLRTGGQPTIEGMKDILANSSLETAKTIWTVQHKQNIVHAEGNEDILQFRAAVRKGSMGPAIEWAKGDIQIREFDNIAASAKAFVTDVKSGSVSEALQFVQQDPNTNTIGVVTDGVSDQKGTKADLFMSIDDKVYNLLSLKVGAIKQFGQVSGSNYETIDEFLQTTFGTGLPAGADKLDWSSARASLASFKQAKNQIIADLKAEFAGGAQNDVAVIDRIFRGIKYHATKDEDGVELVIVGQTGVPSFNVLAFDQDLYTRMAQIDFDIVDAGETANGFTVQVVATSGDLLTKFKDKYPRAKPVLVQIRSKVSNESGNKDYMRNIVEMGALLKFLADKNWKTEQQVDQQAEPTDKGSM